MEDRFRRDYRAPYSHTVDLPSNLDMSVAALDTYAESSARLGKRSSQEI